MATIYLNDGATSLAAANWSDATGLVNSATGVIRSGGQSITSDVDFNAVNVLSLRIAEQFTGTIGSAAAPLWLDATDGSAAEWKEVENMLHWLKTSTGKSPAQQFDESHKRWVENGREC